MTSNPCFFFSMQLKLALNPVKHSTSRESGGGGGEGGGYNERAVGLGFVS